MFWKDEKFQQNYYNFFYKVLGFEKDTKILPVNFEKPWYQIILDQKWAFSLEIVSEIIQSVYGALTPLILSKAIFDQNVWIIIYFALGYLVLEILNRIILRVHTIFVLQSRFSIAFAAYKFFLTVDPIFHTTKSSGQITSKIQSTMNDLGDLLNQLVSNILPVIVGFTTVIITIGSYNRYLALIGIVSFILISVVNGGLNYINSLIFSKRVIKMRDKALSVTVENLHQNQLIRSVFAVNEQVGRTRDVLKKFMVTRGTSVLSHGIATSITRVLYISSVLILSLTIFNLIKSGSMEQNLGLTLIITYVNGSSQILRLGQTIKDFVEKYTSVTDLFEFIRSFGKQSYPVLEGDEISNIS